jgi:hypothetical protein
MPDVVGLAVHQNGRAAVPGRIEPGAPFGRVLAGKLDIDDDIAAFVGRTLERQPQMLAHEALAAVARHQPVGVEPVAPQRVHRAERDAVVAHVQTVDLGGPADLDRPGRSRINPPDRVDQILLDVVLLQVNHRRQFLPIVVRHREAEDFRFAIEAAPVGPGQALAEEVRQRTQALDDFQAAARDARCAAAHAHRVVGLDDERGHAMASQPQRNGETDRSPANDGHAVAPCLPSLA